jgi:hypothetical protein
MTQQGCNYGNRGAHRGTPLQEPTPIPWPGCWLLAACYWLLLGRFMPAISIAG